MRSLPPLRNLPQLTNPQPAHAWLRPPLPPLPQLRGVAAAAKAAPAGGWSKRSDEVVVGVLGGHLQLHGFELTSHVVLTEWAAAGVDRHPTWLPILLVIGWWVGG